MMTLSPLAPAPGRYGIDHECPQFFLTTLLAHILFGIMLELLCSTSCGKEDDGGLSAIPARPGVKLAFSSGSRDVRISIPRTRLVPEVQQATTRNTADGEDT